MMISYIRFMGWIKIKPSSKLWVDSRAVRQTNQNVAVSHTNGIHARRHKHTYTPPPNWTEPNRNQWTNERLRTTISLLILFNVCIRNHRVSLFSGVYTWNIFICTHWQTERYVYFFTLCLSLPLSLSFFRFALVLLSCCCCCFYYYLDFSSCVIDMYSTQAQAQIPSTWIHCACITVTYTYTITSVALTYAMQRL